MGILVRAALRRQAEGQVRQVKPVRHGAASGLVAKVYAQVERDFGTLAPPVILHSPAPLPLAASWLMFRESLVATGAVERAAKEALAMGVSLGNICPFCVEVHGSALAGVLPGTDLAGITADRLESISDPEIRALAEWGKASGIREQATAPGLVLPPDQLPEVLGVAVTFQYFNRMVNIFLGDSPLPPQLPGRARGRALRIFSRWISGLVRRPVPPGASLELLPEAELPADLGWAAGSPAVAGAFARAAAAFDLAGNRSVPEPVRELVTTELAAWDGQPASLDGSWVTDAVARLAPPDRPAGRLALLTAVASYRVHEGLVDEVRLSQPGDEAVLELTAWASFAAARQVGSWAWAGASRAVAGAERPED